jgi:GT2 family glycosyltransferase
MNERAEKPGVSIHLIVRNGERYMRACLEHVKAQDYPNVHVRIFDNASSDTTLAIAREVLPRADIIRFPHNFGLGGGFNRSVQKSTDPYIAGLSVDVLLASDYITRVVAAFEEHPRVAVVQGKILRYRGERKEKTDIIDTTGMQIFKSHRIINRGHGERDGGQYDTSGEIFCYEGAVFPFRRVALQEAGMQRTAALDASATEYLDEDFFWYADEVDLGWRLRVLGWNIYYEPRAVAWHDRQTTHALSGNKRGFIEQRRTIPALKRKLDLRNQRLTFIKNDFLVNMVLYAPWFLARELQLFFYVLIFERSSLPAYGELTKMAPMMLRKRRAIMARTAVSARAMRTWFQ